MPRKRNPKRTAKILLQLAKTSRIPKMGELAEIILEVWGGMRQFAQDFHQLYRECVDKPVVRARLLSLFLQIMIQTQEHAVDNLGDMSEEDIEATLRELATE